MNTGPQPLSVSSLSLHNPSRLSDDEIVATFAARQAVFERVLEDIRSEKPRGRPQHHLVVGQRGMGKSTLLARLAAEVRRVPELSRTLIPLAFAEEQYAVDRLSKFWLNCLDSLADAAEREGDLAAVSRIDGVVGRLTAGPGRPGQEEKDLASATMDAFLAEAGKLGRRPVLLVDNLQLVFDRTTPEEQHVLREFLMRPGAPVLVGTSPSPLVQSQDYGAPFYDHFKVHYLRALSVEEMQQLMLVLAEKAERPDVAERIVRHPHRLQVLHQLSGGNPRTAVTLFFLYAEDFAPSVFGDLENLLDRVTPLYKARFEELAPQQQVVASAIAHHWDPIPAREISDATGLPPTAISAQLDRLDKIGFVERVELFGDTRTGYQITERFFNVWFLMRSASRRQRREVEFLTRFIESFYEAQDRSRLALQIQAERDLSPDRHVFTEALACTLDEGLAHDVRRHAAIDAMRQKDPAVRRRLAEVFEFDRVPRSTIAFADLASKLSALVPAEAEIERGEFVRLVLGDPIMFVSGKREALAGQPNLSPDSVRELVARLLSAREIAVAMFGVAAMDWLAHRLQTGQLAAPDQQDDWKAALGLAPDATALHVILRIMPAAIRQALSSEIERRLDRDLSAPEEAGAMAWINRAWVLQARGSHPGEAEAAYRRAIEIDGNSPLAWMGLGVLLELDFERYTEAEAAYRRAIELDEMNPRAWRYLGDLLNYSVGRPVEAEAAYRRAIELVRNNPQAWIGLGLLLEHAFKRHTEAEAAYRRAIELDERDPVAWSRLGLLLSREAQRYSEAETAFRRAIELDAGDWRPWCWLGNLLEERAGNADVAAQAREKALQCFTAGLTREPMDYASLVHFEHLFGGSTLVAGAIEAHFARQLEAHPDDEESLLNLLFLRRDLRGDLASARPLLDRISGLPLLQKPDLGHLHRALMALYDTQWEVARDAFVQALDLATDWIPPRTSSGWIGASAVIVHLNAGGSFLELLRARGDDRRLRPWYEALQALELGDSGYLRNLAPEIRPIAEFYYREITALLERLPEATRRRQATRPPAKGRARRRPPRPTGQLAKS